MQPFELAALRQNLKAVYGPLTPFLAVSTIWRVFGRIAGFMLVLSKCRRMLTEALAKESFCDGRNNKPTEALAQVDHPTIQHSTLNIYNSSIPPHPPVKKDITASGIREAGFNSLMALAFACYAAAMRCIHGLTLTKNPLALRQLLNSLPTAVHRSETADFLFVPIFLVGQGQSIYFAVPIWGGVRVSVRTRDLSVGRFKSTVPHLFKLLIKSNRLMKELDLSPYLIDVFIHSQQIADWHNSTAEVHEHLSAIEKWWTRHKETGSVLQTGTAYMVLAHLNMVKGYLFLLDSGENWKSFNKRVYRIQAEIIEEFGHANFLWEKGQNPETCTK